jgi:hypothetical protein
MYKNFVVKVMIYQPFGLRKRLLIQGGFYGFAL